MQILVVDDDEHVRESLERTLTFEGYQVSTAGDGEQALAAIADSRPWLVVLDVQMPRLDGLEVCRRLRAAGEDVPVLILTVRDGIQDLVTSFNVGADDFLTKPFALDELLVRIRALVRRGQRTAPPGRLLTFDDLVMDLGTREIRRGKRLIELTRTEFDLLHLFLLHPRQVLTRTVILREVWGVDNFPGSNTLEVYVGYLRRKLEEDGAPRLIQNIRGVGYALRPGHDG
jgi:two-component system response regulator MprA